jgi:hypothetical protein
MASVLHRTQLSATADDRQELIDVKTVPILALSAVLLASGCAGTAEHTIKALPHPPVSPVAAAPPLGDPPTPAPATPSAAVDDTGPTGEGPPGLLAAISTRQDGDHDEVVFQFYGRQVPTAVIRYVDEVTVDPSDKPVTLIGRAFVNVAFHGARLDTAPIESDPSRARRYSGPSRLTPRYALLQELAISGDFEAVLSFGIGLAGPSGLSTSATAGRLVLRIWRTAPETLLWPVTSIAQARDVQSATENGHQPWVLSAQMVATSYVEHVLGWPEPIVQRLAENVYQATAGTRFAVITLSQPLSRQGTLWAVVCVVASNA